MKFVTSQTKIEKIKTSGDVFQNKKISEIYGKNGKLEISGLGGSYGVEKLKYYNMLSEMGPPETHIYEFPMADNSWQLEMNDFILEIEEKKDTNCGLKNAFEVLPIFYF